MKVIDLKTLASCSYLRCRQILEIVEYRNSLGTALFQWYSNIINNTFVKVGDNLINKIILAAVKEVKMFLRQELAVGFARLDKNIKYKP